VIYIAPKSQERIRATTRQGVTQ